MKKIYFALFTFFSGAALLAQNPIPNNDFETWSGTTLTGWYAPSVGGCTKSAQAHTGTAALKMAPWSTTLYGANAYTPATGQGFALNGLNPTSLTGWYMANFVNGDQMTITITIYSGGSSTGSGYGFINTSASSYTQFTVAVYNGGATADSARIQFTQYTSSYGVSGLSASTYVIVDDLQFIGTVGIKDQSTENFNAWYNNAISSVEVKAESEKNISLSLFDLTGKKVLATEKMQVSASTPAKVPANDLSPGIYLLRIEEGATITTKKILIQ